MAFYDRAEWATARRQALHDSGARWTRDEAHAHLVTTFEFAANHRPDLFEPYLIRLADAEQDERSQVAIMREAATGQR